MKRLRKQTKDERLRFNKMLDELKDNGMTQNDFASAVGVTHGFVSHLKSGSFALSVTIAKEIERAFPKYRAAWLLGLDERQISKVDALKVFDPIVSTLSSERIDELLDRVQDFIEFELRNDRG